jgi:hypothetical protein
LQEFISHFGVSSEDLKNLSISALIGNMIAQADDGPVRQKLVSLLDTARQAGFGDTLGSALNLKLTAPHTMAHGAHVPSIEAK